MGSSSSGSASFSSLDKNHDGYLDTTEANTAGVNFSSADKNHDGKLDPQEFQAGQSKTR